MSKIGAYNLELQEQANELGFSTVQEALDNNYEVVDGQLVKNVLAEMEMAHKAWEKEKEEVRIGLAMVSDNLPTGGEAQQAIERAIKFIKEAHE